MTLPAPSTLRLQNQVTSKHTSKHWNHLLWVNKLWFKWFWFSLCWHKHCYWLWKRHLTLSELSPANLLQFAHRWKTVSWKFFRDLRRNPLRQWLERGCSKLIPGLCLEPQNVRTVLFSARGLGGGQGGYDWGHESRTRTCLEPQKVRTVLFSVKGWVGVKVGMTGDKSLWCSWQGHDSITAPKQTSLGPRIKENLLFKM